VDSVRKAHRCTVIVVTYNARSTIRACLVPLLGMPDVELIVIDNSSGDGTAALVAQELSSVRLIALQENMGFGRACNIGVAASSGDAIFLLNPDAIASPEPVWTLVGFLEQHPRAGIAGARLVDPSGRLLQCMGDRPSIAGLVLDKLLALCAELAGRQGALRWLLGALLAKYRVPVCPQPVAWVSGAALCCMRSVWEEIGGFDEDFFLYHEDVYLCLRVAQAGWEVWHVPEAVIVHYSGASFAGDREFQKRAYYASQRYLFRKHSGALGAHLLGVAQWPYRSLRLYRQLGRDRISRPFPTGPGQDQQD